MAATTEWEALRAQISVNEERVVAYRLLIDAEQRLYELLRRRGLSGAELEAAFLAMQEAGQAAERDDDPYLSTLSGYVAALGGQLDVIAVFPDATVPLPAARQPSSGPHYTF